MLNGAGLVSEPVCLPQYTTVSSSLDALMPELFCCGKMAVTVIMVSNGDASKTSSILVLILNLILKTWSGDEM